MDVAEKPGTKTVNHQSQTLHLHPTNNVAIAKVPLRPGMEIVVALASGQLQPLVVREPVDPGHKVVLVQLDSGELVRRYGQVIGRAATLFRPGEQIHTHNLVMVSTQAGDMPGGDLEAVVPVKASERIFLGFRRLDGRVETRNYVAVMANVNCSAFVCRQITAHFSAERPGL